MNIASKGSIKYTSLVEITGFSHRVCAGFPSPADDHLDKPLDIGSYLIAHPSATFYCRVSGMSMIDVGIFDGDLLIVDRALTPQQNDIVVAALDGELTCKRLDIQHNRLLPANSAFEAININETNDLLIEGVVVHSIREHRKSCSR